jgi:hypothetical protein
MLGIELLSYVSNTYIFTTTALQSLNFIELELAVFFNGRYRGRGQQYCLPTS